MIPRSLTWRSTLAALISIVIALLIVGAGVDVLIGRHHPAETKARDAA